MLVGNIISFIKFLFSKEKELYVFVRHITGLWPRQMELYQLAFVHRSMPVQSTDGTWANNERLEYLGDAVLDTVVAGYLYELYPEKDEGFLTSTRAKIVQRESLNAIGHALNIEGHVRAAQHSSSHNSYICGNALEALVGAVYLDRGFKACKEFVENRIIKQHVDIDSLINTEKNFKSRLIEWTQKFRVNIEFKLVDTYNDANKNPVFRTAILLGGVYAADAEGYSKKESHQGASSMALERLANDDIFREKVLSTATEAAKTSP